MCVLQHLIMVLEYFVLQLSKVLASHNLVLQSLQVAKRHIKYDFVTLLSPEEEKVENLV